MTDQRALIIGNTDGIGLGLTRRLLDEGWTVTGISRRGSPLTHQRYLHQTQDVAAPGFAPGLSSLVAQRGPFEVCVYCAGIGRQFESDDLSADLQTFEVNLMGAVRTANLLIPSMLSAGGGHLLVLSSLADQLTSSDSPAYCGSKAAMSAYFEGLALAMRPRGVAVTNIRFGFVDTKMAKSAVRPFMISVEQSVEVIMRALRRRPLCVSHPWPAALMARVLGGLGRMWVRWR